MDILATFHDGEKAEKWIKELNKLLDNLNCYYKAACYPAGDCFEICLEKKLKGEKLLGIYEKNNIKLAVVTDGYKTYAYDYNEFIQKKENTK